MLEKIKLKFGAIPNRSPLEFSPEHMTIFVGPNNSGKSLALLEIERSIFTTATDGLSNSPIIDELDLKIFTTEEIKPLIHSHSVGESWVLQNHVSGRSASQNTENFLAALKKAENPILQRQYLSQIYTTLVSRLDGQNRMSYIQNVESNSLLSRPSSLLQNIFQNDEIRKELSKFIHEAFGYYYTVDPTAMRTLQVKMSETAPINEEKMLNQESIDFFTKAKPIAEFSDGVKAFTGILSALISTESKVILIDEPEAFLHPPLIRKLGKFLTELAAKKDGNVLAATHSADFLMGSIQSRKKVNIIRLTYHQNIPTARLLSSDELQKMMRDPFLRSTAVLTALFHTGAIVCEADMDRAFYQEINERLLENESDGIDDCIFLNANGKDSIGRIVKPLRSMGIPTAVIVDLDIIEAGFSKILKEAFIPSALVASFNTLKDKVKTAFDALGKKAKKAGVNALLPEDKDAAEHLLGYLAEYGIFVVPVGEVENWLPHLGLVGHGPYWLSTAFEKMGTDSSNPNYVHPAKDDVWDFVRKISDWIRNPNKKGMPN